ncbi:titin homolog [Ostrinia furnacalis]|uniref:titin homolog n=1 Tax=Ostrinia furnacalis TaxID=93504 RepID=UPI001038FC66|nr:titin homolog [Ostrinia furnacalis]
MKRSKGDMTSPTCLLLLAAAFHFLTLSSAGPLGPLPNVTSSDLGLKEGSCAVGDVVYMPGDEFPGSGPCERCACAAGDVRCSRQRCEPRPGCKALHRPDQCCPTYQCECEQEGRVYGNGEKLVDPADPCRVCYCQGGEVVCRRIACFLRDDCQPRLVPGRCCPEYDNCPLRGVTAAPGSQPTISSISSVENMVASAAPPAPKENIKQEITIKEITPVSEIPIITDVKIKEILPSPSIEVAEYSSSKSPLIPREATSEQSATSPVEITERPVIIEILPSSPPIFVASSPPEIVASSSEISESKTTHDSPPSKISFSTQDSINSEIYPSNGPNPGTVGSPATIQEVIPVATTTKAPVVIEEEDPAIFDHNPAFPPIPDDLSVQGNHEDEIIPDPKTDGYYVSGGHEVMSITSTESSVAPEAVITTLKEIPDVHTSTTTVIPEKPADIATTKLEAVDAVSTTKEIPLINLRSAIPTEILNVPSSAPEEVTGNLDDITNPTTSSETPLPVATTESAEKEELTTPEKIPTLPEILSTNPTIMGLRKLDTPTTPNIETSSVKIDEETISTTGNSDAPTEITSQTEFSSLPIETSDQNPHEESAKEKSITSSAGPTVFEITPTKLLPVEPEVITVSRNIPSENQSLENVETTEFILTSFGSAESATDTVELIKISPDAGKSAAIIESEDGKNTNVLTDLINLVGDVASISDHTDAPRHVTAAPSISDSEELIPVNAGYKSKNSNWNLNSITEVVPKSKNASPVNKQKIIEIEDDEDGITDSPPPNDKVEPTTRRPIIDNVSADMPENKTDKKDIELITPYVPAEKRPTKVVMKKNNEKPLSDDAPASAEIATESTVTSNEITTPEDRDETSSEASERIEDLANSTSSSTAQ